MPKKRPAIPSQNGEPPRLVDHAAQFGEDAVGEALAVQRMNR